jgi:hypothetical protein
VFGKSRLTFWLILLAFFLGFAYYVKDFQNRTANEHERMRREFNAAQQRMRQTAPQSP